MMNVVILMDNNPNRDPDFHSEHGLSIYFEADSFQWLMDCGASGNFYLNARKLGISIEGVDFLLLSHAHSDHTGGLEKFLQVNHKAKIFFSAGILGNEYISRRHEASRHIGINQTLVREHLNRFVFVDCNRAIAPNVSIICQIPQPFSTPKANKNLSIVDAKGEKADDFRHEMVLAVKTIKGVVVFSGCSHNGVLNILQACSDYYNRLPIIACIGGTHILDTTSLHGYETNLELETIGQTIRKYHPNLRLLTGHCTGSETIVKLAAILKDQIVPFYSGASFEV